MAHDPAPITPRRSFAITAPSLRAVVALIWSKLSKERDPHPSVIAGGSGGRNYDSPCPSVVPWTPEAVSRR